MPDSRVNVSCKSCKLEESLEFNSNPDEIFLEFLVTYDKKQTANNLPDVLAATASTMSTTDLQRDAAVRMVDTSATKPRATDVQVTEPKVAIRTDVQVTEPKVAIRTDDEIMEIIGDEEPDDITREILFSNGCYLADYRVLRESKAEFGISVSKVGLDIRIVSELKNNGITSIYRFQHDAIKSILAGDNTVIEAPTASGKTEAFLIPIIQKIISDGYPSGIYAILVYPTKALARDQFPKIQKIAEAANVTAAVFDGDVGAAERKNITDKPPQILVTNFDLIHYHMWRNTRLGRIFNTVKILVVDEVHTYAGIFGSNVHYIIKRLKRIVDVKQMQIVAASATIDDPEGFCTKLFDTDKIRTIQGAGKEKQIEFSMLFPSGRKPRTLMVELVQKFAKAGHQTMVFSNSHRSAELLAIYCMRRRIRVKVHRSGLMPHHRKAVEEEFKSGALQAISCTPTLELGIDIGSVDCVISPPVPVNRLTQRIGRVARKGQRGYAFLVLGDEPISQYYKNHPKDYFEDTEELYIDPRNPHVEECQVLAMAYDSPLHADEIPEHSKTIERHLSNGTLKRAGDVIIPDINKAANILAGYNIRGMGETVNILRKGKNVGDRVCPIALDELHKGAVYFLGGRPYIVDEFDYPNRTYASIIECPMGHSYYTKPLTTEYPTIEEILETRIVNGTEVGFCRLRIQKQVTGYIMTDWTINDTDKQGRDLDDEKSGKEISLETPLKYTYVTKGIVFCAPPPKDACVIQDVRSSDSSSDSDITLTAKTKHIMTSGYHATEHVVIEGSNMITGGVSRDLGGISMGHSGTIFVHDGTIGGSGASRVLYDRLEKVFERGMHIVGECPCTSESGCPRCTMSYRCGNNNASLHKMAAFEIFKRINKGEETRLNYNFVNHKPIV